MKSYKALIVDDEQSSRVSLKAFVESYCPQLEIIGEGSNIIEAKELIDIHHPEIVFLDIEMPHGNGFDLLDKFKQLPFHVIFVTAFSNYALQALKLSSAQYLLKPIDIEELERAVDLVCQLIDEDEKWTHASILIDNLKHQNVQKIVIPLLSGFEVVNPKDVYFIEADDNFSIIHMQGRKPIMACRKLKFYEDNLKNLGFYRIHRSTLVNLDHVVKYTKGKAAYLTMSNGKDLDIAQSRKAGFVACFLL